MVNTAIIKCYFHDVVIWDVDRNVSAASSFNQAMSSTSYATPFAVYDDGIDVVKFTSSERE